MNTGKKSADERARTLLTSIEQELLDMPNADIAEGEDVAAAKKWGDDLVAAAAREAGKRRLAAAREGLERSKGERSGVPPTADEARRFLARAANDERFTLAARDWKELSDEDAIRLYLQLLDLGADPTRDA